MGGTALFHITLAVVTAKRSWDVASQQMDTFGVDNLQNVSR
jgi:hypothetical protein